MFPAHYPCESSVPLIGHNDNNKQLIGSGFSSSLTKVTIVNSLGLD